MRDGTTYSQKDIVLIPFPYTDLTGYKQRPALIISNSKVNNSSDCICCLITSNSPKDGIHIQDSDIVGRLPLQSWIKAHRLFTIEKQIIRKKVCSINTDLHKQVIAKITSLIE